MKETAERKYFFMACILIAVLVGLYYANLFFFSTGTNANLNLLFVGISAITAFGFWKRPKWFTYFFGTLLLQQLYSHGIYFYHQWKTAHLFAGKSFAIIILMSIAFMALLNNQKDASKKS